MHGHIFVAISDYISSVTASGAGCVRFGTVLTYHTRDKSRARVVRHIPLFSFQRNCFFVLFFVALVVIVENLSVTSFVSPFPFSIAGRRNVIAASSHSSFPVGFKFWRMNSSMTDAQMDRNVETASDIFQTLEIAGGRIVAYVNDLTERTDRPKRRPRRSQI